MGEKKLYDSEMFVCENLVELAESRAFARGFGMYRPYSTGSIPLGDSDAWAWASASSTCLIRHNVPAGSRTGCLVHFF
jgi:hypothetical protein